MIALTDAFALGGWALVVCAVACRLQHVWHANRILVKGLLFAGFVAVLIPLFGAGLPLAAFFRGVGGDLSITLLVLSVWSVLHRLEGVAGMAKREQTALLVMVSAAALLLYPTALGWGNWDAYRLGWGSWGFFSALLVVCAFSVWLGLRVLPALIALALLAWSFDLMESSNLWDYLLDPFLSAYALVCVFINGWQSVAKRFVNRSLH